MSQAGPPPPRRRPAARPSAALALLILGALSLPLSAASRDRQAAPAEGTAWELLEQRPAEGEQCIVCRVRVHDGDIVEVRYKGRTFFVAAKMLARFEADPDTYFHAMQAHGGLFDEAAMETPPMRVGWLVFGLWMLVGLVAGAACAYVALDRGLAAWGWFFAGLTVNVIALAAILTRRGRDGPPPGLVSPGLRKIPTTRAPAACGRCGAANHPAAAACGRCGQALAPTIEPETARA